MGNRIHKMLIPGSDWYRIWWLCTDLRAGEGGRSLWRQLNNKKWAVRNFGSASKLKVGEDGGIARISRESLRDYDKGRCGKFNPESKEINLDNLSKFRLVTSHIRKTKKRTWHSVCWRIPARSAHCEHLSVSAVAIIHSLNSTALRQRHRLVHFQNVNFLSLLRLLDPRAGWARIRSYSPLRKKISVAFPLLDKTSSQASKLR